MDKLTEQEFNRYKKRFNFATELNHSRFLITGITGLIGSILAKYLIFTIPDIRIFAPVRSLDKARSLFSEAEIRHITLIEESSLGSADYAATFGDCEYIVHCAAPTASTYFVEHPVETATAIFNGTNAILSYAKGCRSLKGFVYLSSLEVYGENHDESVEITEDFQGYADISNIRSSYPLAKRSAENLCVAYFSEYGVPVKIARLTQVCGLGITPSDNRILAQFCRLKIEGKPIVLHTTGKSARPYIYTLDAITAILSLLLKGVSGEAYNISNDESYISAYDLGRKIAGLHPVSEFRCELETKKYYPPETYLRLTSQKLQALGWNCLTSLDQTIAIISACIGESMQ